MEYGSQLTKIKSIYSGKLNYVPDTNVKAGRDFVKHCDFNVCVKFGVNALKNIIIMFVNNRLIKI